MKIPKRPILVIAAMLLCLASRTLFGEVTFTGRASPPADSMSLWYLQPAADIATTWLPIGNAQSGALIAGSVQQEHLQFNEKTLWTGSPTDYGSYTNLCGLYFKFSGLTTVSDYRRDLSLDRAVASVNYAVGTTTFTREYFTSFPDNVTVMHLTSNGGANLNFTILLNDSHSGGTSSTTATNWTITGNLETVSYEAQVHVINAGGTTGVSAGGITVSNADSVTILLACGTNYDASSANYLSGAGTAGLHTAITNRINAAAAKSYATLKANHIADYQALFNRMTLRLNNNGVPNIPTDTLLANYKSGTRDPALEVMLFQYGRYMTIASSRAGTLLPANLQGIWCYSNSPLWSSDYHGDINIEMNYFGTELTNLAECARPYTDWIYTEAVTHSEWHNYATALGNNGWVIYAQNNEFGQSNWPTTGGIWGMGAWLCLDLWKHFEFTLDTTYLSSIAYPAMKGCCDFWLSRLKTASDGTLVSPLGFSPEHGPVEDGVSFDQQLIWGLLTNTIKSSQILNVDSTYRTTLQTTLAKLDPGMHVGSYGELREWKYTEDNPATDQHRHQSYAICLYPGEQLLPLTMPALAAAITVTLNGRSDTGEGGSTGYGWDHAWKMALRARLFDGNHAYTMLKRCFTDSLIVSNLLDYYRGGANIFQIDANFGIMAGMAEMLLQSHAGFIHLLPALPDAWPVGNENGLCARGAFVVDMDWSAKTLTQARILSNKGGTAIVKYSGFSKAKAYSVTNAGNGSPVSFSASGDMFTFATVAGQRYLITASSPTGIVKRSMSEVTPEESVLHCSGARFLLPATYNGKTARVTVFDLSGKILSDFIIKSREVDLASRGVRDGVSIVKVRFGK